MEKSLIIGQRYTFHISSSKNEIKKIRGNLQNITYHNCVITNKVCVIPHVTIIVNYVDTEKTNKTKFCIPLEMIVKIENLETILSHSPILTRDILLSIDNFF